MRTPATRATNTETTREGSRPRLGAAAALVQACNGYPAHLQLFAHAAWTAAAGPDRITLADVQEAIPQVAAQLERRTLGPRWDRISDRQMEFFAALALHGGRASTSVIAMTLGRTQQELSWLREELIEEGDVYAPKRGQLAMAVPLFNQFVLSHYERTRPEAATPLLSLDKMIANAGLDAHSIPGAGNPDGLRRRQGQDRQQPPSSTAGPPRP